MPIISGNGISAELIAISVQDTDALATDNAVHDSWNGIVLFGIGSADVSGNKIEVDGVGIDIGADTSPNVDGHNVCGGAGSIKFHDDAAPSMGENSACDAA